MSRKCEVPECKRPHAAKGLCRTHYYAERRGEPREGMGPIKERGRGKPNQAGYVQLSGTYAHRLVMQGKLGRELLPGENVHHRNGDRSDNHPDNLELWYVSQPSGQRVTDLIEYMVTYHKDDVLKALNQ